MDISNYEKEEILNNDEILKKIVINLIKLVPHI